MGVAPSSEGTAFCRVITVETAHLKNDIRCKQSGFPHEWLLFSQQLDTRLSVLINHASLSLLFGRRGRLSVKKNIEPRACREVLGIEVCREPTSFPEQLCVNVHGRHLVTAISVLGTVIIATGRPIVLQGLAHPIQSRVEPRNRRKHMQNYSGAVEREAASESVCSEHPKVDDRNANETIRNRREFPACGCATDGYRPTIVDPTDIFGGHRKFGAKTRPVITHTMKKHS